MGTDIKRQRDSPGKGKSQGPLGGMGWGWGAYLRGLQQMPMFLKEMFEKGTISESIGPSNFLILTSQEKGGKKKTETRGRQKLNTYTRITATYM